MFPVLFILSVLKILLFMHNTKVVSNKFLIFFISILVILFVFSLIYLSCKKKKRIYAFSFYLIVSIIIFVDVVYYSYFNTLPSVNMLSQANQLTAVGDSIKSLLTIDKLLLILDLPLLILYLINRRAKKSKNYNRYIKWGVPGGIFLLLAVILIHLSSINLFGSVTNQELFTYHAKDIKKTILNEDNIVDSIALNVEDLKELKGRNKLIHGKYTGVGKNKNLIVIQLEALQNFVINHSYNGQEITPNLNKLIEENGSLYFNNYYQMLGRGNTSDAEFVTNNSLYPSMEEPTYTQYEKNTFYGLPWVLRDNGYTSWVFHGYEKEFWNRENAYV
ncbi:hypothetical protein K8M07_12500, partial [Schnuerera sp. xch1]|uniref:LTA synthase family protein n=1 Tax=Schnuerera sp. xch1 TaxID=2874283 RepID=UPI001CBE250C